MADVGDDGAGDAVRHRAHAISLGPEAASPVDDWLRAEHELAVAHHYDTLERDLERLGMTIARLPSEAGVVWRLTLPLGETVEAWEPGTAGLAPPHEIMRILGNVLDGKTLLPEPVVLREPGAARLRELLAAQLHALLRHDPGVRVAGHPENLHQHRVAARRVRAFLRATRAYVDPAWAEGLVGPLRELGAATGPARDLDVLLEHVTPELERLGEADRRGAGVLRRALAGERDRRQDRLLGTLEGNAYRLLVARLRFPPRFKPGVDALPLDALARKEIDRLARSVAALGAAPDGEAVHAVRISLKRARYAVELSAPSGEAARRFLVAARSLQDVLGEHQDAVVAEELLRAASVVDDATAAAFVAGRLAERQVARRARVLEQLPQAWRRLRKRARTL